ncbi:plasmid mobilization protein [Staphylococcus epidermidis]|uniref:plasmid mobilization protein n=1 Tax=Staphylococcus epidermidis TaxID=1282 RepID=UPI00383281ED
MPKKQNSKEKILTIRVSHSQYEKICALADIREMNVTEYIRHTAIGNRIKPTIIEQIKESSEVSELFKKDNEALQRHIHQLEDEIDQLRQENDVFHHLLQHFDSTAFMDFSTYRDDRPLKNAIKRLKEQ